MPSMEGLRGLAVLLVFLVHYSSQMEPRVLPGSTTARVSDALFTIGNTGVDLFFVLSGYLIFGTLIARRQPFFAFMRRRIVRIYPTYVVVFLLYVGLSVAYPAESHIPAAPVDAAAFLLLSFCLVPGLILIQPLIAVAWSLSYEMTFYLLLPLLVTFGSLRRLSWTTRAVVFGVIAIILFALAQPIGPRMRFVMFIAGIFVHELLHHRRVEPPPALVVVAALVLGLLSTATPWIGPVGGFAGTLVLFFVFGLLCYTCFAAPGRGVARAFSWTPIRWLGNMSYSYYLIHGLSLKAAFMILNRFDPPEARGFGYFIALLAPAFLASLLPSAVLFLAVERPFSLAKPSRPLPGGNASG